MWDKLIKLSLVLLCLIGCATSSVSDADLAGISQQLHENDVNGATSIDLDLQSKTYSGNTQDKAPYPLFDDADRQVFSRPTYKALIDLFDNYEGDTSVKETVTQAELAENDAFLDAVLATKVMQDAHQFLVKKGLASSSVSTFKSYLRKIWFGMYSRSRGVVGSSGMEHVFVGEWNDSGILGLHSWIRYAFLEQDYYVNYLGYIRLINLGESKVIEMPMEWEGDYKPINSLAVASSPELQLALGTICFLARPDAKCPVVGTNGAKYYIQTYTYNYHGDIYVATAYPTD